MEERDYGPESCIPLPKAELLKFAKHAAVSMVICVVLRKILTWTMTKFLALNFKDAPNKNEMKFHVAGEKLVKACFFMFSFYNGMKLVASDGIFNDDYEHYKPSYITDQMYFNYIVYMGWYGHKCFTDPFEYNRKDWLQMNIHHWVTATLIFLSYTYKWHRVGATIIFLHDPADFFLAAAKAFGAIKKKKIAEPFLVCTAISWLYTRIYAFAIYAIYPAFVPGPEPYLDDPSICFPHNLIARTLIIVLWLLNAMWAFMILKIAYRAFVKGVLKDYRSETDTKKTD